MKIKKLQRRADLKVIEGIEKVKLLFPNMPLLFDFVEEIGLSSIEFNRKECILICKCTGQQAVLAQKKYKAKVIEP